MWLCDISVMCLLCQLAMMAVSGEVNIPDIDMGLFDIPLCHCPDAPSACSPIHKTNPSSSDKQVIMISQGGNTWKDWQWDVITTVISNGSANTELMCYTHSQNKMYGFIARPAENNFSSAVEGRDYGWISDVVQDAHHNFADFMVLDLLDVFNEQDLNVTHLKIFVHKVKASLNQITTKTLLNCLLPWTPPSFFDDSITETFVENCDVFMTGPQSYQTRDLHCRASATVPFTKLILGIDEFVARGFPVDKFFLGVPWHGYDYKCHHNDTKGICHLSAGPTDGCDYNAVRTQTSLGHMVELWPQKIQRMAAHKWHRFNMAPYMDYNETAFNKTDVPHQVWFEDTHSLSLKYHFVNELQMAGVAIWSVDDLNFDKAMTTTAFDHHMWNLLKTALFKPHENLWANRFDSYPSKMAAVGVGCMLLGTVLGFVIGIVVCQRQRSGKLKPPFLKDSRQEFRDEDPEL